MSFHGKVQKRNYVKHVAIRVTGDQRNDPTYDGSTPIRNAKQEAFAQNLCSATPMSQSDAYRMAGFNCKPEYANELSTALRQHQNVVKRVAYLQELAQRTATVKKDDAVRMLQRVMNGELDDTATDGKGVTSSVNRISDRLAAVKILAQVLGWNAPDKVEALGVVHVVRHDDGRG